MNFQTRSKAREEAIILIGPMKAGKTTVAKLLAERLNRPFISLDRLERKYTAAVGFDEETAAMIQSREGDWAWCSYRRQFFADAVVRFLTEHLIGVLELGGGHPIAPDDEQQTRIAQALAPFPHVILLLPMPDRAEALQILRERQKPEHVVEGDWNEEFLRDDTFVRLAKHVVYTVDKSPVEICDEIIAQLET